MFMTKDEWSEDELDEGLDDAVVPLSMVPTPQVISSGGSSASAADTHFRAAAYNERLARARQATKKSNSSGNPHPACACKQTMTSQPRLVLIWMLLMLHLQA